jgi:hypothetical protein
MVSPMQKKLAVEMVVSMGLSGRKRACRVLGLARSSGYYQREPAMDGLAKDGLVEEVIRWWAGLGLRKVISSLWDEDGCRTKPRRVACVLMASCEDARGGE